MMVYQSLYHSIQNYACFFYCSGLELSKFRIAIIVQIIVVIATKHFLIYPLYGDHQLDDDSHVDRSALFKFRDNIDKFYNIFLRDQL